MAATDIDAGFGRRGSGRLQSASETPQPWRMTRGWLRFYPVTGITAYVTKGTDCMAFSKILIPVDGSPASLRAVDFALEMAARSPGTSLVLLHVSNIPAIDLAGAFDETATDWIQEAASQASAKALKGAIAKCRSANYVFETLTSSGQTAETIAEVARKEGVGHIVMGTRGLGGIKGLLLGSVATQVIHLAEVPITLIK
jgi:nucleotide-binding universal stress UspA family protein